MKNNSKEFNAAEKCAALNIDLNKCELREDGSILYPSLNTLRVLHPVRMTVKEAEPNFRGLPAINYDVFLPTLRKAFYTLEKGKIENEYRMFCDNIKVKIAEAITNEQDGERKTYMQNTIDDVSVRYEHAIEMCSREAGEKSFDEYGITVRCIALACYGNADLVPKGVAGYFAPIMDAIKKWRNGAGELSGTKAKEQVIKAVSEIWVESEGEGVGAFVPVASKLMKVFASTSFDKHRLNKAADFESKFSGEQACTLEYIRAIISQAQSCRENINRAKRNVEDGIASSKEIEMLDRIAGYEAK